jgi:hypothetical protein
LKGLTFIGVQLLLVVITLSAAQFLWSEQLSVNFSVNTGYSNISIGSYKVIVTECCNCCCCDENGDHGNHEGCEYYEDDAEIIDNGSTLSTNFTLSNDTEMVVWMGLVISNEGTIPGNLTGVIVSYSSNVTLDDFSVSTYYYGPYDGGDFTVVWANICTPQTCNLPAPGDVSTPITLFTGQKAVVWMQLNISSLDPVSLDVDATIQTE